MYSYFNLYVYFLFVFVFDWVPGRRMELEALLKWEHSLLLIPVPEDQWLQKSKAGLHTTSITYKSGCYRHCDMLN